MIAPPAASRNAGDEALTPQPAVRISGLVKSFGRQALFDGLDLIVNRGERLAILGASGC